MPRMTNTYMLAGERDPEENHRIRSQRLVRGQFSVGGQVDITSGKFTFSASEAYLIEDGKNRPSRQGCHTDRQRPGRADTRQHDR
jgi:TldD protein